MERALEHFVRDFVVLGQTLDEPWNEHPVGDDGDSLDESLDRRLRVAPHLGVERRAELEEVKERLLGEVFRGHERPDPEVHLVLEADPLVVDGEEVGLVLHDQVQAGALDVLLGLADVVDVLVRRPVVEEDGMVHANYSIQRVSVVGRVRQEFRFHRSHHLKKANK